MKKILAIDDQMDNLISVKAVLQTYMPDCEILLAQSGREGIETALKAKPDAILLDIIMPLMDGFETCRKLKANRWTNNIPIIMVTAVKTDVESRIRGLELGADAFISKPYDPAELSAQIRVMLRIKEAEDKLRTERDDLDKLVDIKSEEIIFQSAILQNIVDAAISTDTNFIIKSWNDAAEKTYGWSAIEVIDKPIAEVLKTEYHGISKELAFDSFFKNGFFRGEVVQYHKNGNPLTIISSVSAIKNNAGNNIGFVALNRDITVNKQIENSLRESEEQFRMLAETTNSGIFIHSGDKFQYINQATSVATGFLLEELYQMKFIDLVFPDDRDMILKNWKDRNEGKSVPSSYELRLCTKEGSFIWAEVAVNLIDYKGGKALIGTAFNITERKIAENRIQKITRHFQSLIEKAPDGIVLINHEGNFKYLSPSARKMFGYNLTEEINGNPAEFTHPEDLPLVLEELTKLISDPTYNPILQYRFSDKSGNWKWVESIFTNLYSDPDVEAIVINFHDITERKLAEKEINDTHELLSNLAQQVPGVIYQYRLFPDGRSCFPYASNGIQEIYEVTPEEVREDATPVFGRIHPDDYEMVNETISESAKNQTFYHSEFRVILPKQGMRWRLCNARPELLEDGSTLWHGIISDITEKQNLENALKESEENFRCLFENSPVGISMTSTTGALKVNKTFCDILGYSRSEMSKMNLNDITHPDDIEKSQNVIKSLLKGEAVTARFEKRYIHKNGNIVWADISTYLQSDETGRPLFFITTFNDISLSKISEELLKDSEDKFRAIFENNSAAIAIIEADTTISMVNDAYCKMSGYKKEDVVGKSWTTQIPPDDLERLKEYNQRRLINPNDAPDKYEFKFYKKDGDIADALMSVSMIEKSKKIITSFIDISARKKAEQSLKESEEKFSIAFKTSPYAISITEIEEGRIIDANDSFFNISGYTKEEAFNKTTTELALWADLDTRNYIVKKIVENGLVTLEEIKFRRKDGSFITGLFSGQTIKLHNKTYVLSSINDITELKIINEAIKESEIKFRNLVTQMQLGLAVHEIILDDSGQPVDYRFIDVNPSFEKQTGLVKTDIIGKSVLEILPDTEKLWIEKYGKVALSGEPIVFENFSKELNRYYNVVAYQTRHKEFATIIEDITIRKLSENKIKEVTENWNKTFDAIQDAIILLNSEQIVVQSNKAFDEMVKQLPVDIYNKKCAYLVHGNDCHAENCPFKKMLITKKRETSEMKLADMYVEVLVDPILDSTGEIAGAVHIIKDITEAKKSNDALIESENKHRLITENTADVIWSMDMMLNFTFVSPAVFKLRGYTPEEAIKMRIEMIMPEESLQKVMTIFTEQMNLLKNGEFDRDNAIVAELDQYRKDGSIILTENTISFIYNAAGEPIGIMGISRDISERKKAEIELKKNESRLKALVGILQHKKTDTQEFLDIALEEAIKLTESKIGYIYFYNEDQKQFILNCWSKDVMAQCAVINPQSVYDLEKTGIWGETVRQAKPIMINDFALENPLKKGTPEGHVKLNRILTIPVFSDKKIVAVVGVANSDNDYTETDILQLTILMDVVWQASEHKKSEEALFQSEEKYRTLIQNLPVGIYRSTPEGKLISANSAFIKMFNLKPDIDFSNVFIGELYYDNDDRKTFIKTIEKQGYLSHYEVRLITTDKKQFWVSISGIAVKNDEGKTQYIDGVISNIDDRKKSEELIRQKTEELQHHKDHLEELVRSRTAELEKSMTAAEAATKAKSEFLANMSHEIRTPMNAIVGFSELLYSNITDSKQLSQLNSIRTSAKSLMRLINDILDLSKVEAGKMKLEYVAVNIKSIIHEIESVFKQKISEKGLAFNIIYGKNLPSTLIIDEVRFRQILFNLIGNAVKFTNKGSLTLTVDFKKNTAIDNNIDLLIKVQDTGIGIPPEQQELIFDAFSQVKGQDSKKYGGTGLGLTITKRLVEIMNGSISLSSVEGTGSVFEVYIPEVEIAEEETIITSDIVYNPKSIMFKKAKMLICDDSFTNRRLIIDLLENSDLEISEAENGKQAIKLATELQPDLILMDLKMPEIDGFEATRIIKGQNSTKDIPIIALSASTSIMNIKDNIKHLFAATIIKPVNILDLIKTLKLFLKYREVPIEKIQTPNEEEIVIITKQNQQYINEILSELENHFLPYSVKVNDEQNIDKLEDFAKEIKIFGEKFSINIIINYGNKLSSYAENFEIEQLSETIKELPSIISKIKNIAGGTI